jgi:hypothetical protein
VLVKRLVVVVLACSLGFAAAPGDAQARDCGLPRQQPMYIDFADGSVPYWPMFARPGVIAAAANFIYPAQLRQAGAKTVYWEMNLRLRVGTPTNPMDPTKVEDWADRVFYRAVASSACARPWIALNEMWGSNLPTPWSATNAQYRANVLTFVRRLSALGATPFVLLSTRPFTDGDAGDWWRQVALYANLVREIYFPAPQIHRQGPVLGSRNLRNAFRQGITDLTLSGIPPTKLGIFLGFHTNPGQGGREGLKPASAWFNHIKLQVLAAKQVSREIPFGTIWSWGWGEWNASDRDPDKPAAACVYLWSRDRSLCDAPRLAGPGFDQSMTVGQLRLPAGAQCKTPWGNISASGVSSVARVTGDSDIALSALFARAVLRGHVKVTGKELRAAQRAIIRFRFGGSMAAYRRAVGRAGATLAVARGVISDELRQAKIERGFKVRGASGAETLDYYRTVATEPARLVEAKPAPWWLGRKRRGVAIEGTAPAQVFGLPTGRVVAVKTRSGTIKVRALGPTVPLSAFPFDRARSSIRAALVESIRDHLFDRWLLRRAGSALAWTTCRRDRLPAVGTLELTAELPFLALMN